MKDDSPNHLTPDDIETTQRLLLALLTGVGGKEALEAVTGGWLEPPNEDGLFELVAPDGVLAKVVDGRISGMALRSLIRGDVTNRLLRNTFVRLMEEGKEDEAISDLTFSRYTELRKQYRLVKLPTP